MSFNLSLAQQQVEDNPNLVHASKELETKTNPITHEPYKADVTEGGININKSKAPAVIIDGPLGHTYTEMLNNVLSKESMGAIVAALSTQADDPDIRHLSGEPTGFVDVTNHGQIAGTVGNPEGYLYVADGDHLPSSELTRVMSRIIEHRNKGVDDIGVAIVTEGPLTPTAESLIRHASAMGAKIAIRPKAADAMITGMLSRKKD